MKKRTENKYLIFDRPRGYTLEELVKDVLRIPLSIYYKTIMNLVYPKDIKKKYEVAICAIFRDESEYLKEWLEFHRVIGVEHFYLYNNFSEDNYLEVLQDYIDKGIVTLTDWPYKQSQMAAYEDCIMKYSSETKWVGFVDLDEFVIPNKNATIQEFLSEFQRRPVVIINWKYFASAGNINRDVKSLVTETFIVGWEKYSNIGKIFFNTSYDFMIGSNQYMHTRWSKYKNIKMPPVNMYDRVCLWDINPIFNNDLKIQINHYLIKSYNEYIQKKSKRGGGVHGVEMHNMNYLYTHENQATAIDVHAYKYLTMLKLRLDVMG